MKKFLITCCLILTIGISNAFHIVGGEIEFIYVRDGVYRINLVQYFDQAQNQNPGPDPFVTVSIFRNGDNVLMSSHTLQLGLQEIVEYTNIECAIDELRTLRVQYTAEINLSPEFYASEEGYYIQWERCCRNAAIDNIVNPAGTGMNYVLEIPPLMKDGKVFVNSSPILFKPLSDYACVNQLYYVEFTGVDPDGDSLVYSLTTPLNSSSAVALPIPQAKPHFGVNFLNGFSEANMVGGSSPLKISNQGLLTVNPDQTGLFVFAVKVEEYRDGEKIGEVRRDFQILVVDGCAPPAPPVVDIAIPGNPTFNPDTDVLTYTASDTEKCFDFLVSNVTVGENITLRAKGVNFNEELNEIFTLNRIPVGDGTSELQIEVCIPECPPILDAPFILDLIAADDACPLPQLDTLRLTIQVEPPPNAKPIASSSPNTITLAEDSPPYSQVINGIDADGDELEMSLFIEGIEDPASAGFELIDVSGAPGNIQGTVVWNTDCETFDFSEIQNFNIGIIVNDGDICDVPGDTLYIDATVVLPSNTNPVVALSSNIPSQIELGSTIDVDVLVTDADGDDLSLSFVAGNFDADFYGASFSPASGSSSISSNFSWNLACDESRFADGQEFELLFIADDDDKCKVKNFDTLRHVIQVNYPVNSSPQFDAIDRVQSLRVNEYVELAVGAFDVNPGDEITIQFAQGVRQPPSASLDFTPVTGRGRVQSTLKWQPECNLLRFGETSSFQDVVIQVSDNACPVAKVDTIKLTFQIFDDGERQKEFSPPNIFTPNGDGKNDTFSLSGNPDRNQNLPPDNCDNTFEFIVISNRAGAPVFKSESRDFVWTGGQFPSGIYYYVIKYTNTEFKGYVHLMK
ncbi:MAG: gliding motility-associated C-terminal domain-containing protein [Ekhidna sp.]